jgi:hypothetical protein
MLTFGMGRFGGVHQYHGAFDARMGKENGDAFGDDPAFRTELRPSTHLFNHSPADE